MLNYKWFKLVKKSVSLINYEPVLFLLAIGFGVIAGAWQTFLFYRQCIDLWSHTVQDGNLPLEILNEFCHHINDRKLSAKELSKMSPAELQEYNEHMALQQQMDSPLLTILGSNGTAMSKDEAERVVQNAAADLTIYLRICYNVPTLVTALLAGTLTDMMGRKPVYLMILSTITVGYYVYIVNAVWLVGMSVYWLCFGALIVSTLGSSMAALATLFSGMSDMSNVTSQSRNLRMAYGNASLYVGIFLGSLLTSQVLRLTSDYGLVWLILVIGFFCSAFWMFLVARETSPKISEALRNPVEKNKCQSKCHLMIVVVNKIRDALKTMVKKRHGGRRVKVVIGLFAYGFVVWFSSDVDGLLYQYLEHKLEWTDYQYSLYASIETGISALSLAIVPLLISKALPNISDLAVILVVIIGTSGRCLLFALLNSELPLWMGLSLLTLTSIQNTYFYAYLSKQVEEEELGRIFALLYLFPNIFRTLSSVVFNQLYTVFLNEGHPGYVYLLQGGLFIIPWLMIL